MPLAHHHPDEHVAALAAAHPVNADPADPTRRPQTYRMRPEFMAREMFNSPRSRIVGREGCWGARWNHGPLCFERYTGDVPPDPPRDGVRRFLVWQPVTKQTRPKGWWPGFADMSIGNTAYAPTVPGEPHDARWSQSARRQARRFKKSGWIIREITSEEYSEGLMRCRRQDLMLRALFKPLVPKKIAMHPGLVRLYGAAPAHDAPIQAGFIAVDVPETQESTWFLSFNCKAGEEVNAATGLIDHWISEGRKRGLRWFDFGLIWRPGADKSWKGFTRFKQLFAPETVDYPTPFIRLYNGRD